VKFSIQLSGWKFPTDSQSVEVEFNVKIPEGRSVKADGKGRGHQMKFSLGADAAAYFPKQVNNIWPIDTNYRPR